MFLLICIFFRQNRYFVLLGFLFLGIYAIFNFKTHGIHVIPINFSHFPDKPMLNAYLEGEKVSLLIDIGSCSELGLQASILDRIMNKKFIKTTENMDAKGNTYSLQTFLIPSINIGNITIKEPSIQEEDLHSFINSGLLWSDFQTEERKQKKIKYIQGKIGRAFFSQWTCLFDCSNSKLLLAKNAKSLLALYSSKEFIEIPFSSTKYGILVSLNTALGTKSFLLDTGATVSLLRESQVDKKSAQEIRPNRWKYKANTLKWNGHELGSGSFWLYEFCPEITFDGVLGIDFFKTHIVLIDFENHLLYISNCFN